MVHYNKNRQVHYRTNYCIVFQLLRDVLLPPNGAAVCKYDGNKKIIYVQMGYIRWSIEAKHFRAGRSCFGGRYILPRWTIMYPIWTFKKKKCGVVPRGFCTSLVKTLSVLMAWVDTKSVYLLLFRSQLKRSKRSRVQSFWWQIKKMIRWKLSFAAMISVLPCKHTVWARI